MKMPYLKLLAVLSVSFIILAILSIPEKLEIFGYELTQMSFAQEVKAEPVVPMNNVAEVVEPVKPVVKAEPDTMPKTILFVGDSMLEGLCRRLAAYASHNGHKLYTVIWYASSTEKWGTSPRLAQYMKTYKPDFVFICLGGNELFIKDIKKKRTKYVQKMVADIGSTPFIWIGPPNWKEDTGINDMIHSVVGDDRFFLSKHLHFDRAKDGAHPTRQSAYKWMDSVITWYKTSPNPQFKLDTPKISNKAPTKTIVHTPND